MLDIVASAAALLARLVVAAIAGFVAAVAALVVAIGIMLVPLAPAWAQDGVVVIPWGAWVTDLSGALIAVVVALGAWLLRQLPRQVLEIIDTLRLGQVIGRAVIFGINAVAGAAKDQTLPVEIGNRVVAEAFGYAIRHAPGLVRRFLGDDWVALAEKIYARLPMEEGAAKPDFAALVEAVSTGWQSEAADVPRTDRIALPPDAGTGAIPAPAAG